MNIRIILELSLLELIFYYRKIALFEKLY